MKKFLLLAMCASMLLTQEAQDTIKDILKEADTSSSPVIAQTNPPRFDDFENITNTFQIRNLRTGIPINVRRNGDFNSQNWQLRQFQLRGELLKKDKLRDKWDFGYVQFVEPGKRDNCLVIAESGFLEIKSCLADLQSGKLESVFSIIPTSSGAVQIRSLVLDSNECLSMFDNPQIPEYKRIGILPCTLDFDTYIDTTQLFFLTPQLMRASALKPKN